MISMNRSNAEPPQGRQERLRFVETMVLWEGIVRRQRVRDAFGVNVNHVTKDLRYYQEQFPDALDYRPEKRGYVAGPKFKPHYASDSPTEYLGLLQAKAQTHSSALAPLLGGEHLAVDALPSPAVGVDKEVLQAVAFAIHHRQGISATYHTLSGNEASTRTLWPHALFNTGLRWYVRAFDSKSQEFRSFLLTRLEGATRVSSAPPLTATKDNDWHKTVVAHVIPNPGLNSNQQAVIAREFGMTRVGKGWVWKVELRPCLVGHFVSRYHLDDETQRGSRTRWLALKNPSSLKPYFFPRGGDSE